MTTTPTSAHDLPFDDGEWVYDGFADPSVGIFGGGWVHVACDDDGVECVEDPINRERTNGHTIRTTYRVTCLGCRATTHVTCEDFDPSDDVVMEMSGD